MHGADGDETAAIDGRDGDKGSGETAACGEGDGRAIYGADVDGG